MPCLVSGEINHPHLFFSADQIPEFRERITANESSKKAYLKMIEIVDRCEGIKLPGKNSNIREEWRPIVTRYPRISTYAAFLYLMDGKKEHLELAREYLLKYAGGFDEFVNFHNNTNKDGIVIYDTGSIGIYSAWTYDMIYNELSPEERIFVEEKLLRAIVETIRKTTETVSVQDQWAGVDDTGNRPKDYDWGPGQWNGNMYCNTGLAAIGFVLQDEALIEQKISNWKVYLERDMFADGMWQEEDFSYSRFCYASMQVVAEMAYQNDYPEDLYHWEVKRRPFSEWDTGYVDSDILLPEGEDSGIRTMKMFLDAQIDYQYPNLGPNNSGWQTNRASFLGKSEHVTFYELGNLRYKDPVYGWLLNQMDRSKGTGYAQGYISPILYGGSKIETEEKPDSVSRWYNHSKWVVLKSIEGKDYWNSDSLFAFMPYGGVRTKSLRPLSLDLFAFGKTIAPRVAKNSRLQAHDKDYYLTDDSWNAHLIEGRNLTAIRDKFTRSWMRFHDFNPELKIAQACIEVEPQTRTSIWYDDVIKVSSEEMHVDSRLVAMSSDYVIDVLDIRYSERQAYKHHFEWVWHAIGEVELDGIEDGEMTHNQWAATWLDPSDKIGLKTTMLASNPRGGTKVSIRHNAFGPYLRVLRGNYGESFVAIHEPFREEAKIDSISRLYEEDGMVAVKIIDEGNYTDYLCVSFAAEDCSFVAGEETIQVDGNYGYIRIEEDLLIGRGNIRSFRISGNGIVGAVLNGEPIRLIESDGYILYDRK